MCPDSIASFGSSTDSDKTLHAMKHTILLLTLAGFQSITSASPPILLPCSQFDLNEASCTKGTFIDQEVKYAFNGACMKVPNAGDDGGISSIQLPQAACVLFDNDHCNEGSKLSEGHYDFW